MEQGTPQTIIVCGVLRPGSALVVHEAQQEALHVHGSIGMRDQDGLHG